MGKKWVTNYKHPLNWNFEIEHDPYVDSYYLYIWNEKGFNTHDYDQDTLTVAQEQAFEDFGVPMDSWIKVE